MEGTPPTDSAPQVIRDGNTLRVAPTAEAGPQLQLTPAERRRSERVTQYAEGWLSNAGNAHTSGRQILVADLSLHGVGLVTQSPCQPGERRWILINRGHMRLSTRIQIASCRQRDDGQYDVGGEFY